MGPQLSSFFRKNSCGPLFFPCFHAARGLGTGNPPAGNCAGFSAAAGHDERVRLPTRHERHAGESRIEYGTGAGIQIQQAVTEHWTPAFAGVTTC